jgi:uncharacterized protein YciW
LEAEDKMVLCYPWRDNPRCSAVRLAAALQHAHLLTLHPRDARPAELQPLLSAGWSATGAIVTLSQLVSFLAFQIRTVAGLKALAAG